METVAVELDADVPVGRAFAADSGNQSVMSVSDKGPPLKRVFGFTGLSNSGKTTLVEEVIEWFRFEGYSVSAVKHAHHGFDIDKPGKDSHRMREAGAQEVLLVGGERWVMMREYRSDAEPTLTSLVDRLSPCDIVLVEGFKLDPTPKIEVFRPSLGRPPLWPTNKAVVALATDAPVATHLPCLDLNSTDVIASFVLRHLYDHCSVGASRAGTFS